MDELFEQQDPYGLLPIERCRELLAAEALELSDEDVDAIRHHVHALAHTLVEVFLLQQRKGRG